MHVEGNIFTYNSIEYPVYADTDQSDYNKWTAGNTYTCTVSVMGVTAQGEVTIV